MEGKYQSRRFVYAWRDDNDQVVKDANIKKRFVHKHPLKPGAYLFGLDINTNVYIRSLSKKNKKQPQWIRESLGPLKHKLGDKLLRRSINMSTQAEYLKPIDTSQRTGRPRFRYVMNTNDQIKLLEVMGVVFPVKFKKNFHKSNQNKIRQIIQSRSFKDLILNLDEDQVKIELQKNPKAIKFIKSCNYITASSDYTDRLLFTFRSLQKKSVPKHIAKRINIRRPRSGDLVLKLLRKYTKLK